MSTFCIKFISHLRFLWKNCTLLVILINYMKLYKYTHFLTPYLDLCEHSKCISFRMNHAVKECSINEHSQSSYCLSTHNFSYSLYDKLISYFYRRYICTFVAYDEGIRRGSLNKIQRWLIWMPLIAIQQSNLFYLIYFFASFMYYSFIEKPGDPKYIFLVLWGVP